MTHFLELMLSRSAALGLMAALSIVPQASVAQDRALPVSVEMDTLFRRALSRPGAVLLDAQGGTVLRELSPFEVFYIYEQTPEWTKVGSAVEGAPQGYIATPEVLDWNTNIVTTFNNRAVAGRDRHLIFDSREKLVELIGQEDVSSVSAAYRDSAIIGSPLEGSGIVSIEPDEYVDIRDRLYIIPILEAERSVRLPGKNRGNILKIASMSLPEDSGQQTSEVDLSQMPIEVVFVIDTTRSMQPYINGVQSAAADFAQRIEGTAASERIRFGLIEYRDNIELAPGLEFVTDIALALSETSDVSAFVDAIGQVEATTANSDGFNEDALAGLHVAINDMNWSGQGAKFIYLITDAGPREENTTIENMRPAQIRDLATERNIAIFTWHLLTSNGAFDHGSAGDIYRQLSQFSTANVYTPIDQGDPQAFTNEIASQIDKFAQIVEGARAGLRADELDDADPEDPALQIGLAMQLAYLGEVSGTSAPDVFEGWTIDRGIPQFQNAGLDIRIMLTRNELSTMSRVVETMIINMEDQVLDPTTFFEQMQTAMALLSQDSSRVATSELNVLGDAVGAYLAELPYQSEIMSLTEEGWISLGGGGQQALKNKLRSKLRAYQDIYADPALWTALDAEAPEGEHVSLIRLDLMP